ncbi:19947_t:CDS:2, partial [Gigaspora margarita]
ESDDNISQSISHTNESNKDNLDFMHIDSDNFSNIELEIMAKKQSEDSNDIYVIESTDSFYETEESEEEMNKPEMIDEWKKIGKCAVLIPGKKGDKEKFKKCGVEIHTQGSTTNFASHLLTHGIVKPQLAIKKVNNSQSKIDIIFKKTTTNNTNRKEAINQALVEFIIEDSQPFYLLKSHAFIKLINLLDPFYELPSDKFIKTLIHQAFFYSTNKLKALFAEELISLIDHSDDQIEDEIENMNFDDITTIFDNEEIVIDYDYNDEVEITANAKKVKVNQFVETNGLVYKVKNALYEALKYYWKLPLESSLIATFLDPRCKRMDKFYEWEREQAIEAVRDLVQKHANQDKTYSKHTDTNINNKLLNLMFGNQEQLEHDE